MLAFERPLSPGEQLLLRDQLRTRGRAASLVGATYVTALAGSYLFGKYVLGPIVGHACYALDRIRSTPRRRTPCA